MHLNWVKVIVIFVVLVSLLGSILTSGQLQSTFEQLFAMGFVFVLVVTFLPKFIVGEEEKDQTSK